MFLDLRVESDFPGKFALLHCFLRNAAPEKYLSVLREIYRHASNRVKAYCRISPLFADAREEGQACPRKVLFFKFAVAYVLLNALSGLADIRVELIHGKVSHLPMISPG